MADNVTIPATGTGTATPVVATDDVGGAHYQRVKLDAGGDGAATPVLAGNGTAASSLRVTLASDSTGTVAVTNTGTFATQSVAAGDIANDAADSGNPIKTGAKATTGLSGATMVADADRVNSVADVDGAQIVRTYCPLPDAVSGNASNTDGTSTQVIAAQAANVRTYITTAILTNTSASNIYVELKDGTTVMATIPLPANGGAIVSFPVPLKGTAATAWSYDPSAGATTTYCTLVGFKSKV